MTVAKKLPTYEVEFVPVERRLLDRRFVLVNAALPPDVKRDRRTVFGRRGDERKTVYFKK